MKFFCPFAVALMASVAVLNATESLSDAEVSAALDAIGKSFVNASDVDEAAQRRAALAGLVVRLAPNVRFVEKNETAKSGASFFTENLDERLVYVRLGAFDTSSLLLLDYVLGDNAAAMILDLRGTGNAGESRETSVSVEFAQRFIPEGEPLFTVKQRDKETPHNSGVSAKFGGRLVVLANKYTIGVAEVLAGALHSRDAMLIGEKTPGSAMDAIRAELNKNTSLEIATANIVLANGRAIFPDGLAPDLVVAQDIKTLEHIFAESQSSGSVKAFVFEAAQQRFNEAELVARTNSEMDEGHDQPKRIYDTALQRAVDLVTAWRFFDTHAKSPEPPQPSTASP